VRVPTGPSSTDELDISGVRAEAWRSVYDVGSLFRFRLAGLRGRARHAPKIALCVLLGITVLVSVVPALIHELAFNRNDAAILLASGYVGVLIISILSSATSGGGRELLPRDQAVAFPVSPTSDHLGALLMAPLNIAWLLQSWAVLGLSAYAVGPHWTLPIALLPVYLWLATCTSMAQALAWVVEWVRRGPRGPLIVRTVGGVLLVGAALIIATGSLTSLLDNSPTLKIAVAVVDGSRGGGVFWGQVVGTLIWLTLLAALTGAWLAGRVARRPARDELRVESASRAKRRNPRSDLLALLHTDRIGIVRSVPMRRGMAVLAMFPGLVAIGGSFRWDMLGIFPGLVASGGALLFGVNSWCLDGRGALWRDSLPVSPRLVFTSRAIVLSEILLMATAVTIALAALRAGKPTVPQLLAVVLAAVVVTLQVVATALRWSVRHPYAVDLRSARATPAPPLVMVGYSSRLALGTTFTGLLFNISGAMSWYAPFVLAVPFVLWSTTKLALTANAWARPETRSAVIATVAS
jgi:hypothetical protein